MPVFFTVLAFAGYFIVFLIFVFILVYVYRVYNK